MRYANAFVLAALFSAAAAAGAIEPGIYAAGAAIGDADATIATASPDLHLAVSKGDLLLDNGSIRLVLRRGPDGFRQQFLALDASGQWRQVLHAGSASERVPAAFAKSSASIAYPRVDVVRNDIRGVTLRLAAESGRCRITTSVSLDAGSPCFHILVEAAISGTVAIEQVVSSFAFAHTPEPEEPRRHDFAWARQLQAVPEGVVGDDTFAAPAVILQRGDLLAGIVPDVAPLAADRRMKASLGLHAGSPACISYGLRGYAALPDGSAWHAPELFQLLGDTTLRYGFFLFLDGQAEPGSAAGTIGDFLWSHPAKPDPLEQVLLQRRPLDDWRRTVWEASARHLMSADEISFTEARQTLKLAAGLAIFAKQTGDEALLQAAAGVLDTAAAAPADGCFPLVFRRSTGEWLAGVEGPGGAASTADCSNAARWLLICRDAIRGDDPAILGACRAYADLLLRLQAPSGAIPAWAGGENAQPSGLDGAESAQSAAFLAELFRATHEEPYIVGAMSALQFINREILPSGRWLDGAVRGLPLDAAGVGARSASAMVAAARAGVDVYDLTGRREYLAMAEHILDSLALLQAAWDCPWSGEPFGSIRSSNAGPERSAALQAEAAGVFIDCGLFTNEKRYTERGIAALRAAFASIQAPLEGDSLLSAAGAVAAAELLRARHGDAVVDAEDCVGWGISDCIVSDVRADERTVSFTFVSPWPRPAVVQFRRCSGPREVVVNGVSLGEYDEAELAAGVTCVPRLPLTVSAAPVERCLAGLDLELAAEVTGGACPPDVVLTSRRAGSAVVHKTAMLPCGGVYTARVPAELLADPGMVEYTITATAGDERAAAPGTGRSPGEGVIEVLPELALACGLDDSAYVERECEALEECTSSRVGRMATPASPVFYRLPLPPGTRAADLAVWTDGCCDVLAGGRMLEPAGQCPGPACTWTADDPALWQDGWLRICIRPSDGSSTLVRRIVLTPR